jgi:hypothetical protein
MKNKKLDFAPFHARQKSAYRKRTRQFKKAYIWCKGFVAEKGSIAAAARNLEFVSKGMLQRFLIEGIEPVNDDSRTELGLPLVCKGCGRQRYKKKKQTKPNLSTSAKRVVVEPDILRRNGQIVWNIYTAYTRTRAQPEESEIVIRETKRLIKIEWKKERKATVEKSKLCNDDRAV